MNKVSQHIMRRPRSLSLSKGRLAALFALLFLSGSLWAQSDSPYVIKVKGQNHYLAHVYENGAWTVKDATSFSPNCIWYSGIEQNITGTNHNYYFDDGTNLHFLSAPMQPNGAISVSATLPPTYLLSNTDTIYYFYDWDAENGNDGGGVARGHQYYGYTQQQCTACGSSWGDEQCWRVYWIAYKDGAGWKLTSRSYYSINQIVVSDDGTGGRYRKVTADETITPVSGGLTAVSAPSELLYGTHQGLSATISTPYTYIAYTLYSFVENGSTSNHYYYDGQDHTSAPTSANGTAGSVTSYEWTLSGPGAEYLSFASGSAVDTVNIAAPTLYYRVNNVTGDKDATLKLKVTYNNGMTQESTVTVTAKTPCQNPQQAVTPVVNYDDVVVTWYDIADKYYVQWKTGSDDWSDSVVVISPHASTVSYRITGLANETTYQYRVTAFCSSAWLTPPTTPTGTFTTGKAPDLLIYGSVFGGGRVANVTGKTEVVIVNCDSIGAVYGGNDIAGTVQGNSGVDGSTITLGTDATEKTLRIGSVYGGGNGYYAYGGNDFYAATTTDHNMVLVGANVYAQSQTGQWNDSVWTNTGSAELPLPTITKTAITVNNDYVKVDSIFGGAKNAFLNATTGNGSYIDVKGGTIFAVFGGNNVGGSQGAAKQHVLVEGTKVETAVNNYNNKVIGRDFGIGYLFGGGNKVDGSTTDVVIKGGMCDTVFAGGNSASVATAANVQVNCAIASGSGTTWGNIYSNAISGYSNSGITIKESNEYAWNGSGIYNVRTLFGGNNRAGMAVVPTVTLTSGSVGTVYGGGNAGDMNAEDASFNNAISTDFGAVEVDYSTTPSTTSPINISTYVVLNSANMLVDYLYGGCQMSNVYRSTFVEMSNGYVGTVYGGCNISGDVGSRYLFSDGWNYRPRHERYQAVQGATYVKVSGGHIYKDLFAGSNGRYHCNNGKYYVDGINFDNLDADGRYIGMSIPSHNETHVYVSGGEVGGSVYAGGNLACVGFINESVPDAFYTPVFVGMATVRMSGGHVKGNVFGGGNMASIWGSNSVKVEGGAIDGALYGGNDRIGLVAQITNRVLPPDYGLASDGHTSLADVRTYISLTGRPDVGTVYGGGNGDYDYTIGEYCNPNDQPVQSNTFVDVNIDGFAQGDTPGGRINTVYGGGNGVTVTGSTTVFLNVKGPNDSTEPTAYAHVGTIFGGNNKGPLAILPNIVLLKGQVDTIYAGCNQGAMIGSHNVEIDGVTYNGLSSLLHLRDTYNPGDTLIHVSSVVRSAAYGGCRMNGVDNNSLVLVEGGNHGVTTGSVFKGASFYGGSDISGDVGGLSHVIVKGGATGNIFGGGNGNYDYTAGAFSGMTAPKCGISLVEVVGGACDTIFGGGLGQDTKTLGNVTVNIGNSTASTTPVVNGDVYGGSALGTVNTSASSDQTNVTLTKGTIHGDLYGGGLGNASHAAAVNGPVQVTVNGGKVDGSVYGCNNVNGAPQSTVKVDVYSTDPAPSGATYALGNVFGGGNQAAYGGSPEVTVHNCDNSIGFVYGGGNKASVVSTNVKVYGGNSIGYVFAGGNGEGLDATATMVSGTAVANIYGGTIGKVFGGNNASGAITGTTAVNVDKQTEEGHASCDMKVGEVYGGGNLAAGNAGTITIGCTGTWTTTGENNHNNHNTTNNRIGYELEGVGTVYGGANEAAVYNGVDLNIVDGIVENVFGGNNTDGLISDTIRVNINKTGNCDWYVGNVYGGGNLAAYNAPSNKPNYPKVNIKNGEVSGSVYGGGLGTSAVVTGNPKVNVGDNTNSGFAKVDGNVYGGGNAAKVSGNTHVVYNDNNTASSVTNLFGGGNQAGVTGTATVDMTNGKVSTGIYGGCNTTGDVAGAIAVNVKGGTLGVDENHGINIHGGGYGQPTTTGGDVNVTIGGDNTTPIIYGAVYGGSALGGVNADTTNLTKVWLKSGTVNGRVYGGGLGDKASLGTGHSDIAAAVNGKVQVINDGVDVTTAIYGCNNLNGGPAGKVAVTLNNGTVKNVVGGGNLAAYTAPMGVNSPVLNITGGEVTHKVVGGGNAADVTGNPRINISNGILCSSNDYDNVGIYGGCNESGTVNGNITLNITGDDTHQTTIGTAGAIALNTKKPVKVFGGGYGPGTSTTGNVTVNYGKINGDNAYAYPMLYGDLYGGSALGEVNSDVNDTTTVNILNGSFKYTSEIVAQEEKQYGGSIYGGGLGDRANNHPAKVNGVVHVNVGDFTAMTSPTTNHDTLIFSGMADLVHCNVYGCNNVFGSPQHNVFVDVYNTKRTLGLNTVDDLDFAALSVFGGGNLADYRPSATTEKAHVYFHGCENTTKYVYGGGNAAFAQGVETIIEGGHFDEVFGGGNGLVSPANIGTGGIGLVAFGGHVNFLYEGSNKQGTNDGGTYTPAQPTTGFIDCGELFVDSYFFGDNEAEHIGDLNDTIKCGPAFNYKYVYAGSRYAVIYGDVSILVQGGHIENLFGGSRGYDRIPADIRKYPTQYEIEHDTAGKYSQSIKTYMQNTNYAQAGQGGNINILLEGGTIGNVFGGCDVNGNVEGKITVTVNEKDALNCDLFVGNVYGASNLTEYNPTVPANSPEVNIYNGTVGGNATFISGAQSFAGNVFGGGNEGAVTSSPKVTVGYTDLTKSATVLGSVYGAGNRAKVTGNTNVILQGNADIRTNVFGGGKSADVEGSTNVILKEQ